MFDMMNRAKNAIEVYNSALQVHTANIANMSTVGYKSLDISFQSILENMMASGSAASTFSNLGGTNPLQFGQGVGIASTPLIFTEGSLTTSNNPTDLAVSGIGLFIVSNDGGSTYQYTRSGQFSIDGNGNLVTDKGMQVYGLNSSGSLTPITGLSAGLSNYSWDEGSGELRYSGASTGYRIALTYFMNTQGLKQTSATTYSETPSSGSPSTPMAVGGTSGVIKAGQLEQSNVNYSSENIALQENERAMSANLSVIKALSDLLAQFISKLG